jgi:hypothetical protein
MDDLAAEVPLAHFAEHPHALAGSERLLLTRVEVEESKHELRSAVYVRAPVFAILLEQRNELSPWPVPDIGVDNPTFGLLLGANLQLRQRHDTRVILVAKRQMQHEVLIADEAEPRELVVEATARGLGRIRFWHKPIIVGFVAHRRRRRRKEALGVRADQCVYHFLCDIFCGEGHERMSGILVVAPG